MNPVHRYMNYDLKSSNLKCSLLRFSSSKIKAEDVGVFGLNIYVERKSWFQCPVLKSLEKSGGEVACRKVGVERPYPNGSRVLCGSTRSVPPGAWPRHHEREMF